MCYEQMNVSLRCSERLEEHLWDVEKNDKILEEYLAPSVQHGEGKVMVWGCFGGRSEHDERDLE